MPKYSQLSRLHLPTPSEAAAQYKQAILDGARPCPFCGGTDLDVCEWELDEGETFAIECTHCYAGAPVLAWQRRTADK